MSSTAVPPAVTPPVPLAAKPDFPTWLPPMLVKELRQGLRTRGFVGAFIVFQVIMALMMVGTVFGSMFGNSTSRSVMATTINGFFWTLLGAQLLLATPVRALGTLQVELDSRGLDLLMLTRLTAWRIVLGKWISLMAQALLLLIAMLPYGLVRYFLGTVDLVQDAQVGASMVAGCALLTAAGLACSGLPKIMRLLVPVGLIFAFQVGLPLARVFGGPTGGSPFSGIGARDAWVWWFNGAIVLGLFLATAVRRIAPPAESYVGLTRGLALASLAIVPVVYATSTARVAFDEFGFAALLLGVVGAVELASMRWPMLSHWGGWAKRGPVGRGVGRLVLPGWSSAFAFVGVAGVFAMLVLLLPNFIKSNEVRMHWLVVLAVTGLVFPALLLSFFSRLGRSPGLLYGLVLVLSFGVAALAALMANGNPDWKPVLSFAALLPGGSFWITLLGPSYFTEFVFVGQLIVSVAVLGAAAWRTRIYWQELARLDGRLSGMKK